MREEEPLLHGVRVEQGVRVFVMQAVVAGPVVDRSLVGALMGWVVPEQQSMSANLRGQEAK